SPANGLRFYPDDPIAVYPEPGDASDINEREASEGWDYVENNWLKPWVPGNVRAMNLNTVDEVPDSSWFTNRIGARALAAGEITRGPDRSAGPVRGRWRIQSGKSAGIMPGFTMRDAEGTLYFIKVDPPQHPELASGAEVISTKLLYALGYNVPENYIATFRMEDLDLTEAKVTDGGKKRPMTREDLERTLSQAARADDGSYRVIASRALPGKPLGPFRYFGTRPDDPNDVVAHEHRRELRALRVFAAWINHVDSRGINSLDTLVDAAGSLSMALRAGPSTAPRAGRKIVRHNLLDFSSTLGSGGFRPHSRRSGNEYLWDVRQSLIRMATLGLVVPSWALIDFPEYPSIGHFEAETFDPVEWRPHYRHAAMENARPDDLFWAARRVMAFSDEAIRAAVRAGQYSDKAAETYLANVLIARRNKIGRAWLTVGNPLVDFTLSGSGQLTFRNEAARYDIASAPDAYRIRWARFDNATHAATPIGDELVTRTPSADLPAALRTAAPSYVRVEVRTMHPEYPSWASPVYAFFRREGTMWKTVGIER
ncbi:MAG: hypothetical protein HY654_02855, partial [Acidobacteria bacterium]|nr:hypothetical protein [Acidobacteriota bacterium]